MFTVRYTLALVAVLSAVSSACGSPKDATADAPATSGSALPHQDAPTTSSISEASADSTPAVGACKSKTDCPEASADVSADFSASGGLVGNLGTPVQWRLTGLDRNTLNPDQTSSVRKVTIMVNGLPAGATATPSAESAPDSTVEIDWNPAKAQTGSLKVTLRDLERCLKNESAATCGKRTFLPGYDKNADPVAFEIVDPAVLAAASGQGQQQPAQAAAAAANVVKVSDPKCGNPTSSSQVTASVLAKGLQTLMNPMGSLINMLTTSIANSGSSSQTNGGPHPCI